MPRLNVVDPATATGKVKEIFDGPLQGKHFNIFKGLANSPAGLDFYLSGNGALAATGLSDAEKEAIALAVGEANQCNYCVAAHTAIGKGAGLSDAQTVEARRGHMDDARLDALVKFTLRLHEKRGFVDEADLETFKAAGYTDGHVVEVVACYAMNIFTNYFNHLNDSTIDFPAAPPLEG